MAEADRKLPPLYSNPVALNHTAHAELKIAPLKSFKYASGINSAAITLSEVPTASRNYPIVFAGEGENAVPAVVLGYSGQKNAFVDDEGKWREGHYVPAYIRRYPFIFFENPETQQLTLCIDLDAENVGTEEGEPIFEGTEPTEAAKKALAFCEQFQREMAVTRAVMKAIDEAGILAEKSATVTLPDGKRHQVRGFRIIEEQKFLALDDEAFLKLRKAGALPVIYSHLLSMRAWTNILG